MFGLKPVPFKLTHYKNRPRLDTTAPTLDA